MKRNESGQKHTGRRALTDGAYSVAVTALSLALLVTLNLLVLALPKGAVTRDVSSEGLYSIGESTREVLRSLEEDVTLYHLTENGKEDEAVVKLTEAYDAASPHVHTERIDMVTNPTFAAQYTEEEVPLGSVIAVSGEKARVASYKSFYVYDSYGYYGGVPSYWDAEGQITSAIAALTDDSESRILYTTGHNELPLGEEMTDALGKAGIAADPVNLLGEEIPEGIRALIVFAPEEDFTEAEIRKLRAYLENGGRMLLATISSAITGHETERLDALMAEYGVRRSGGLVMEGDASCYVGAPYLILPECGATEVTDDLAGRNLICALPEALIAGDTDDAAYTVRTLLATGEHAYRKEAITDTVARGEGDESGCFVLALEIEQTLSRDSMGTPDLPLEGTGAAQEEGVEETPARATRILWYASPCLFSSAALSALIQQNTALPEGNTALFTRSVAYLTDRDVIVSVPMKSLAVPQTLISSSVQRILGSAAMYVLPALVLLAGVLVCVRRRRR